MTALTKPDLAAIRAHRLRLAADLARSAAANLALAADTHGAVLDDTEGALREALQTAVWHGDRRAPKPEPAERPDFGALADDYEALLVELAERGCIPADMLERVDAAIAEGNRLTAALAAWERGA